LICGNFTNDVAEPSLRHAGRNDSDRHNYRTSGQS
jgi:hypothetical protein